jgi:hydroxyacylglutathione hydrolase
MLSVELIPCLSDNYVFLIRSGTAVGVVDPADPAEVQKVLDARGWKLTHILNTHHHLDHVGGNLTLKEMSGCTIIGPRAEAARIPGLDVAVGEGDMVAFGDERARVFDVPAHTAGHIAYWFETGKALFCGDTMFAMGCGRLFEGTAAQMYAAMRKFDALPGDTQVFCAHEYTESNGRFALSVEPDNTALVQRMDAVRVARAAGNPTVPTTIALEQATNPFLRAASVDELAVRRAAKDTF